VTPLEPSDLPEIQAWVANNVRLPAHDLSSVALVAGLGRPLTVE
jgi:hypothetical protein